MGLFSFGKKSTTFLTVVTSEGQGRLRLNGLRADSQAKKAAIAHERTVCWAEFNKDGGMLDKGVGRAPMQAGQAVLLLRDLATTPACRGVLERLREGQESVAKWLQLNGETVGK